MEYAVGFSAHGRSSNNGGIESKPNIDSIVSSGLHPVPSLCIVGILCNRRTCCALKMNFLHLVFLAIIDVLGN